MSKVAITGLSDAMTDILSDYGVTVNGKIKTSVDEVSKNCVKELKATSPKRTGNYAKGWTRKKEVDSSNKSAYVVHNSKHYRLTHLLEKGHAKRGGGRTKPRVHIAPAEEKAISEIEKRIKDDLK